MSLFSRIFALDLRSLAVLRIGVALLILFDLADRAQLLRAHYTDTGILPRAALARAQDDAAWSLHLMAGDVAGVAVLFALAAALAVALLVGWHTRLAAVASFILLISLQARCPPVSYGADGVLRSLLFFAMLLPVGARFSLDARRAPAALSDAHFSVPAVALTVQVALIYVFTGIQKLSDASWTALDAVRAAVTLDHHATSLGQWLAQYTSLTRALTLLTLLIEIALPALLFIPLARARVRIALIAVFSAFHVASALCLHLGWFPAVSILAWLALLPAEAWRPLATRFPASTARGGERDDARIDVDPHRGRALVALLGLFIALTFSLKNAWPALPVPRVVEHVGRATLLDVRWNMFIKPLPDGFFVAPGTLGDGRVVDLLRASAPVSFDASELDTSLAFPSMRSRKLLTDMVIDRPISERSRRQLLRYFCRTWNAANRGGDRLVRVDLMFVERDDVGGRADVRRLLETRTCLTSSRPRREPEVPVEDSAEYFEMKPRAPAGAEDDELDGDEPDDAPDAPGAPGAPGAPDAPGAPGAPGAPDAPDAGPSS